MKKPNRPSTIILWLLLAVLITFAISNQCKAQQWVLSYSFTQDKMIHPLPEDEAYRIHTDNVYRWTAYRNQWGIGIYYSGHERAPLPWKYSNGGFNANGTTKNRNNSGIYFQHPIPWLSNWSKFIELSIGHRLKIIGDPVNDEITGKGKFLSFTSPRYSISFNIDVPVYKSKGKFSVNLQSAILYRYNCGVVNFGGNIKF